MNIPGQMTIDGPYANISDLSVLQPVSQPFTNAPICGGIYIIHVNGVANNLVHVALQQVAWVPIDNDGLL